MQRYRDLLMFVCGLAVGAVLVAAGFIARVDGTAPTVAEKPLESKPRAKASFVDSLDDRRATAIVKCLQTVPTDQRAYHDWLIESDRERLTRCIVKN